MTITGNRTNHVNSFFTTNRTRGLWLRSPARAWAVWAWTGRWICFQTAASCRSFPERISGSCWNAKPGMTEWMRLICTTNEKTREQTSNNNKKRGEIDQKYKKTKTTMKSRKEARTRKKNTQTDQQANNREESLGNQKCRITYDPGACIRVRNSLTIYSWIDGVRIEMRNQLSPPPPISSSSCWGTLAHNCGHYNFWLDRLYLLPLKRRSSVDHSTWPGRSDRSPNCCAGQSPPTKQSSRHQTLSYQLSRELGQGGGLMPNGNRKHVTKERCNRMPRACF